MIRRPAHLPALVVLVALLGGCALPAPDDAEPGTGVRPGTRTAATCADLAPPGSFDAFFTAPLELVDADRTDERLGPDVSSAWSARAAGGIACEWQSAGSSVTEDGLSDVYEGVRLRLLPANADLWDRYADADPDGRILDCTVDACASWTSTPNGWWLGLDAPRLPVESEARVTNAFDVIVARVAELPAPTAADGPHSGDAVAAACEEQVSPQRVAVATGVRSVDALLDEGTGFAAASLAAVGGTRCVWRAEEAGEVATVTVLPGAAWALAEAAGAHGSTAEVVVRGHESPGVLRMDARGISLDLALDGDWVRISVPDDARPAASPVEAATGIAIALVAAAAA